MCVDALDLLELNVGLGLEVLLEIARRGRHDGEDGRSGLREEGCEKKGKEETGERRGRRGEVER